MSNWRLLAELMSYATRKGKDQLQRADAIDWDKQMVVGIMTGGGRGDAGNLAFVSFQIQGELLTVHYKGPAYPDHPCASNSGLALIPRYDGKVKFLCENAPNEEGSMP